MSKTQQIQKEMMAALKAKDTPRKDTLSLMLSALKAKAKDERRDLTEEEENALILKEIKQTKETHDSAPQDRKDIRDECEFRIRVLSEFAPKEMDAEEIADTVKQVLSQLGLTQPTAQDKGIIMKTLMPLVKGKADGKLVNEVVGQMISK